jgi:Zn-dependent protease
MSIPGIVMGFTFHEFAHAWTATWFGDDTPRLQGRASLNPAVHLDIIGTLLLLIGGFGWAKPVNVNLNRLRPRVLGDIAVSLAGVTMNFLLAIIFYLLTGMSEYGLLFGYDNPVLTETLFNTARINLILVGFNLIPLPPLDGFHVFKYLFPRGMEGVVATLYRMGPVLLMLLIFSGVARRILGPIYGALETAVSWIVMPVLRAMIG